MYAHAIPLVQKIDNLLAQLYRRYHERYEQAAYWTNEHCPTCGTPIRREDNNFCHICGANLIPAPPAPVPLPPVDDEERHTSGIHKIVIPARPTMQSARDRHKAKMSQVPTSEMQTPNDLQQLLRKHAEKGR